MKALITIGCMTDHGGQIILGDSSFLIDGKAVHLDGMAHYCPRCKVQSSAIASHQGFMVVAGRSIVAAGDNSTCGARYLKISDLVVIDNGARNTKISSKNTNNNFVSEPKHKYGKRFLLRDQLTREPLVSICYEVVTQRGTIHGHTDNFGYTELITSDIEEEVEIKIMVEEHNHGE